LELDFFEILSGFQYRTNKKNATTKISLRPESEAVDIRIFQFFIDGQIFSMKTGIKSFGLVIVVVEKIFDSIIREKLLEFRYNCAAKVLLCAKTNVGLCTSWITLATADNN
jgi:hypothetical protein